MNGKTIECPSCSGSFPFRAKKPYQKYCSHRCYSVARKGVPLTQKIARSCRKCKNEFLVLYKERTRVFCSRRCYHAWSKGRLITPWSEKKCPACGEFFVVNVRKPKKKYCSHACFAKGNTGHQKSEATRAKLSIASKAAGVMKRLHKDPEFQRRRLNGLHKRPNRPEVYVRELLKNNFPGEYRFTGDGSFLIDGLNPDFTNVNGQKKVIEVFGEAFHDPKSALKKVPYRGTEGGRRKVFRKFGYEMLVIWTKEIDGDEGILVKKIRRFHENCCH